MVLKALRLFQSDLIELERDNKYSDDDKTVSDTMQSEDVMKTITSIFSSRNIADIPRWSPFTLHFTMSTDCLLDVLVLLTPILVSNTMFRTSIRLSVEEEGRWRKRSSCIKQSFERKLYGNYRLNGFISVTHIRIIVFHRNEKKMKDKSKKSKKQKRMRKKNKRNKNTEGKHVTFSVYCSFTSCLLSLKCSVIVIVSRRNHIIFFGIVYGHG
jgi:hypothetical protein